MISTALPKAKHGEGRKATSRKEKHKQGNHQTNHILAAPDYKQRRQAQPAGKHNKTPDSQPPQTRQTMPHDTTVAIRKPKKGSKAEAILTLTATTPAIPREIAETVNVSREYIYQVLERYGLNPNTLDSFKEYRADILTAKQEQVLKALTPETLKEASANNLAYTLNTLHQMERLERDQSTSNADVHCLIADLKRQKVDTK